ncbi:metal ABC transporter ATP-binding protein [Patescibacteria group bacterium]|nr:metal ABC transporter ATP-binding protein [Patescibacteria group bacterium]
MVEETKNQPVLEIKNVNYTYPGSLEPAIYKINFSLQPKTINMIIGPNGSGKSTLLKVILGILKNNGKISFFDKGKNISHNEAHIGYVPQKSALDTTIPVTVNELLSLTQKSCKRCSGTAESEIVAILQKVNAVDYRYKKIGDLSGGQLQRVILGRALLHHPKLLILDEPEAGIDIQGEQFFYEVLQNLVEKEDVTALIATHEMEVVNQYADQVLCLNKTLICAGTTAKTLNKETFEKLYGVHTRPFNHTHAMHTHEGNHHEHAH